MHSESKKTFEQVKEEFLYFVRGVGLVVKIGSSAVFIFYIIGFFVWNRYLGEFNFFEVNVIKTLYPLAGFLFVKELFTRLSLWLFVLGIILIISSLFKINKKLFWGVVYSLIIIFIYIFITTLQYFPVDTFPNIERSIGGGQPVAVSIIGNEDEIKYLENFDIRLAENAESRPIVQTYPVCLIYQNENSLLVGVLDYSVKDGNKFVVLGSRRVLQIDKKRPLDLQVSGGSEDELNKDKVCSDYF